MKKYLLTLLMASGMLFSVHAQQKMPTASELTKKSVDSLDKRLKLNATQRSIIYNYTLDMYKEQLELGKKQQTGQFSDDDVAKIYKTQNQTTANIKNILKGDQLPEYDKYLEEQLRGGKKKKKKKGKHEEEEVVTGIAGLKLPATNPNP